MAMMSNFAKATLKSMAVVTALALVVQPAIGARFEKSCVGYMEADAIYHESLQKLEIDCPGAEKYGPLTQVDILIVQMGPPKHPSINPDPNQLSYKCLKNLYDMRTSRDNAYLSAYDGPKSKIDSVMERLVRLDRLRCYKQLRQILK